MRRRLLVATCVVLFRDFDHAASAEYLRQPWYQPVTLVTSGGSIAVVADTRHALAAAGGVALAVVVAAVVAVVAAAAAAAAIVSEN